MTTHRTTLQSSALWFWLFPVALAAAGSGVGFLVRPAFAWTITRFETAPGLLRVAAEVPTAWAVPILTVVGAATGVWIAAAMRIEGAKLVIDDAGVRLTSPKRSGFYAGDRVAAATKDGDELVLLDAHTNELVRVDVSTISARALSAAFQRAGYRWLTAHPYEFRPWVDGHPDLPDELHRLLRDRNRALADSLPGTVDALTERLRDGGIAVRDRGGAQTYRRTVS